MPEWMEGGGEAGLAEHNFFTAIPLTNDGNANLGGKEVGTIESGQ